MNPKLVVPCTYQGGKQRIASQIVDELTKNSTEQTRFFDLCCGSGAISVELINRGILPSNVVMLDVSSWGAFWEKIGSGSFDIIKFRKLIESLPIEKKEYKNYCSWLSSIPVGSDEAELYTILQANSFGGKQISLIDNHWHNACFRDYWEPTETSKRRSPANPMQPSPEELLRRVELVSTKMKGIQCIHNYISSLFDIEISSNDIVYIDPPYKKTTGYAYNFDVMGFITKFKKKYNTPLFVSESVPLCDNSKKIVLRGPNGGITGVRKNKHEEWLSLF